MTGFARERGPVGAFEAVVSVKTVNHRGLDLHFYTGSELDPHEGAMRTLVKQHVARGHVDVRVQLVRSGADAGASLDMARLDAYADAWRAAADRLGAGGTPDIDAALRAPGVLNDGGSGLELDEDCRTSLLSLLEKALSTLNEFRNREGREIVAIMRDRAQSIAATADEIEELRRSAVPAYQTRLRDRLAELLGGTAIDPQRLVQEAALLADRSDIVEEIDRLRIHARQIIEILSNGAEVGKKLDFLLQEMNRETNTILSKTNGLAGAGLRITELAIVAKTDIEKLREQALNLE